MKYAQKAKGENRKMSRYSGKCDLADHIAGTGGWYDKNGNPVKFGDPGVGAYYSDEMKDFIAFKEKTGGKLYQHRVITVTPWNYKEVEELTEGQFKAIPHTEIVEDKRLKEGKREKTTYTYKYWGNEYTSLKELNKNKVYFTETIEFKTLLDLIPYYPYLVSACVSTESKTTVYITKHSFVDDEYEDHLRNGWRSNMWRYFKKELQDHYRDVVLRYFNPEGREHTEKIIFEPIIEDGETKYIGYTSKPIDENFYVTWHWENERKSFWCSPIVLDYKTGKIELSKQDYEQFGSTMLVDYVEKTEYKLVLE